MVKNRSEEAIAERERLKGLRSKQRKEDQETGRSRPKTFVGPQPEIEGPTVPSAKSVRIGRAQAKARGEKPGNFQSSKAKAKSAEAQTKRGERFKKRVVKSLKASSTKAPTKLGRGPAKGGTFKTTKPTGTRKATVVKGASQGRPQTKKAAPPPKPKRSTKKK